VNAVAIILSLLAFLGVAVTGWRGRAVRKALTAAKTEAGNLKQTLAHVLDGDGEVRGQLMLPGETYTAEAVAQLNEAQASMEKTKALMEHMRAELTASLSREQETAKVLAEIVDDDGTVLANIRLPGEKIMPNRTPCGDMCKFSFWHTSRPHGTKTEKSRNGYWACRADQGRNVEYARSKFLDGNKQCVMWERDDDC